jgi:hypothetical protein
MVVLVFGTSIATGFRNNLKLCKSSPRRHWNVFTLWPGSYNGLRNSIHFEPELASGMT